VTASIRDLIVYRLQRARESLEDAHLLADARRWNPCEPAILCLFLCRVRTWMPQAEVFVGQIAELLKTTRQ